MTMQFCLIVVEVHYVVFMLSLSQLLVIYIFSIYQKHKVKKKLHYISAYMRAHLANYALRPTPIHPPYVSDRLPIR